MIDLKQKELNEWQARNFSNDEDDKRVNEINLIIRSAINANVIDIFSDKVSIEIYCLFKNEIQTYRQILGMFEEGGELAHWYLKGQQGIRGVTPETAKEKMADAYADSNIFGTQVMTCIGVDAEKALQETTDMVLKRDWKNNPNGNGYSQHKE